MHFGDRRQPCKNPAEETYSERTHPILEQREDLQIQLEQESNNI